MSDLFFHVSLSLVIGPWSSVTSPLLSAFCAFLPSFALSPLPPFTFSFPFHPLPFLPFTFSALLPSSGLRFPVSLFHISHFTSPVFTMALGAYDGWETPLLLLLILLPIGIWLAALIDITRSRFKSDTDRLLWIVVVTLAPFIGVLLYWILGKRYKIE